MINCDYNLKFSLNALFVVNIYFIKHIYSDV